MGIKVYPYKMGSISAYILAKELGCKRVYPDGEYRNNYDNFIVNWGASQTPSWKFSTMLNYPDSVEIASNKLKSFRKLGQSEEVSIPTFATDIEGANALLGLWGYKRVYCRTILTGHSGNGIVVAEKPEQLVEAPLYVGGISGLRDEYRVHVFDERVIDVQKKMKKLDADPNTLIRNHGNGYIYGREGIEVTNEMCNQARYAVGALNLDFGAVDLVVMRDDPTKIYVLEVNTAPGLVGETLTRYVAAIKEYADG